MKLIEVYKSILREQAETSMLEFPNDNFVVSIFPNEKRLLFSPIDHTSITQNIRTVVQVLKQNFRILNVTVDENTGVIEVVADPREDFEQIINLLNMMAGQQ